MVRSRFALCKLRPTNTQGGRPFGQFWWSAAHLGGAIRAQMVEDEVKLAERLLPTDQVLTLLAENARRLAAITSGETPARLQTKPAVDGVVRKRCAGPSALVC